MRDLESYARALGGRPLIGVAPRWNQEPTNPHIPEHLAPSESNASYFIDAILAAGGMPVQLPLLKDPDDIQRCVDLCDGIALPGGHDVDPKRWGDQRPYDPHMLCQERDDFEFPLVLKTLQADKPLFVTCRGAQVLNVALGGTLCMDVSKYPLHEGCMHWRHEMILNDPAHPVRVQKDSLLWNCVGQKELIQVNSSHHCCVDRLGKGVKLVGKATDGVPEAIEVPSARFCLGVQWHPEYTWQTLDSDLGLWKAFVEAAKRC